MGIGGRSERAAHRRGDLVLALNLMAAANAANAWRPVARGGRAGVTAFAAGWATSELPLETLGAHAAMNAAAFALGENRGWRGAVGTMLAGTSAAGLVAMHGIAKHAGEVYEQALVDALGVDYREGIVHPEYPGADPADAWTPGVARMLRARNRFVHGGTFGYGPAGRRNNLDIWRRTDVPLDARAPVLLQIPGGAWVTGDKRHQAYPLLSHLAERGWVCVAANYRLSPRSTWPDQIIDVKRALAWVKQNIAAHGGDPDFVAITGGSAGGHLSSLAALTPHEKAWQPGFEDVDTSVAAAAPFYGAYDWLDDDAVGSRSLVPFVEKWVVKSSSRADRAVFEQASPMWRIHADAPPFVIAHGTNDSMIPVEQGRLFAQRLRAVSSAPVAYAELPHAQHAFDVFGSARANLAARATAAFFGSVYGRYTNGTRERTT